jgi:hypothetical protein
MGGQSKMEEALFGDPLQWKRLKEEVKSSILQSKCSLLYCNKT